jgi:hypothetical protein
MRSAARASLSTGCLGATVGRPHSLEPQSVLLAAEEGSDNLGGVTADADEGRPMGKAVGVGGPSEERSIDRVHERFWGQREAWLLRRILRWPGAGGLGASHAQVTDLRTRLNITSPHFHTRYGSRRPQQ